MGVDDSNIHKKVEKSYPPSLRFAATAVHTHVGHVQICFDSALAIICIQKMEAQWRIVY